MYIVSKRFEVAGCHSLRLPYQSKCANLHGHNWIVDVEISADKLNADGMVMDFTIIKKVVMKLDHSSFNGYTCSECGHHPKGIFPDEINTTAENIAKWIASQIQDELDTIFRRDRAEALLLQYGSKQKAVLEESDWDEEDALDDKQVEILFNDIVTFSENKLSRVSKITIQESEGNVACYIP